MTLYPIIGIKKARKSSRCLDSSTSLLSVKPNDRMQSKRGAGEYTGELAKKYSFQRSSISLGNVTGKTYGYL